jgi:hypothetical protein
MSSGYPQTQGPARPTGANAAVAKPGSRRSSRREALLAASWPASAAMFCAIYAFFPEQFPPDTGQTLLMIAAAELPCLFLGVAHAAALKEGSRSGRYLTFAIGVGVLLLMGGARVLLEVELRFLLPMLGWVLLSFLVELWTGSEDPELAHDQAWAVLQDRGSLLALLPALLIGCVLLAIFLQVGSLIFGGDFGSWLSQSLQRAEPSLFALIGSVYLGASALCAAHAHGHSFRRTRRRLLDRPWVDALTNSRRSDS